MRMASAVTVPNSTNTFDVVEGDLWMERHMLVSWWLPLGGLLEAEVRLGGVVDSKLDTVRMRDLLPGSP